MKLEKAFLVEFIKDVLILKQKKAPKNHPRFSVASDN